VEPTAAHPTGTTRSQRGIGRVVSILPGAFLDCLLVIGLPPVALSRAHWLQDMTMTRSSPSLVRHCAGPGSAFRPGILPTSSLGRWRTIFPAR
jgi:hypothetical protein